MTVSLKDVDFGDCSRRGLYRGEKRLIGPLVGGKVGSTSHHYPISSFDISLFRFLNPHFSRIHHHHDLSPPLTLDYTLNVVACIDN